MALRPSHCESIRTSVWAAKSASTQPVSRLVALPLPQTSSVPLNVVLFAASWQLRLVMVGSCMRNVPPDWVVLRVTGFGPFQAAVPLPCRTCSWVRRTAPVSASTSTVSRLYALGADAVDGGLPGQPGGGAEGVHDELGAFDLGHAC